jgi:hypothetical protein
MTGSHEVRGSIPLGSTNHLNYLRRMEEIEALSFFAFRCYPCSKSVRCSTVVFSKSLRHRRAEVRCWGQFQI